MTDVTYNYVVTAQKPTAVTHAIRGRFTSKDELNLIVAKGTLLELSKITEEGLQPILEIPLYGRVAALELYTPTSGNNGQDLLFILTERYDVCVLRYDTKTGTIRTHSSGNVRDVIGRATEGGQIGIVDPSCRLIGLHLYDGLFKVVPLEKDGKVQEAFNVRLEELQIIDMCFLHGTSVPTVCVLFEDGKQRRHVKTYKIILNRKEFVEGPWNQPNVESGASILVPVPTATGGGVLILGQQSITYHNGQNPISLSTPSVVWRASGKIDADGSRYLLGDHLGCLWVLVLKSNNGIMSGLDIDRLGVTSIPSTIVYLDSGVVHVGSGFGDSQLVRLLEERNPETRSFVEILDLYQNLGPIVDFCVVDLENQGRGQVVTCSGAFKDGSLRIIRNGIGINEQAAIEMDGIKGLWALKPSLTAAFDKYLVMTFRGETRVLGLEDQTMEEVEVEAFDCTTRTLVCANMLGTNIVQVSENSVNIANGETLKMVTKWSPPVDNKRITVAAANPLNILLALGGGKIILLEMDDSGNNLKEINETTLDNEVSCIDISPLTFSSGNNNNNNTTKADIGVIGTWNDMSVHILNLPKLEILQQCRLSGDTIARSVLLTTFDNAAHLLVGLGDGNLVRFMCDSTSGELTNRKKIALGTQPINLTTFRSKNSQHVFAGCDRPVVVYSSNGKVHYSSVNRNDVNVVCPFNTEDFEDCLALASEDEMCIGTLDEIQKLHVRTVPLNEQPRRICHSEQYGAFAIVTNRFQVDESTNGEEIEMNYIRLMDEQTFDIVDSFTLDDFEQGISVTKCVFKGDETTEYFVVGTAYALEDEPEPSRGRILVFKVSSFDSTESSNHNNSSTTTTTIITDDDSNNINVKRLELVAQADTPGAVYTLKSFNGNLLAGVNSKIQLYEWSNTDEGVDVPKELNSKCGLHGHILALYLQTRGDFILVGDLMKSISLCVYKPLEGMIEEIARDFNANWMTAIGIIDDDTFIGAEHAFNLFVAKKNSTATSEEERGRLEITGEYHLGEFVNCFQDGSLVMQPMENVKGAGNNNKSSGSNSNSNSNSDIVNDNGSNSNSMDVDDDTDISTASSMINIRPTMLFATVSGSISALANLTKNQFDLLHRLQNALNEVINGVGGFSHSQWRAFCNERNIPDKTSASKNFIDGDLIERFLDLGKDEMSKIVDSMIANRDAGKNSEGNKSSSGSSVNDGGDKLTVDIVSKLVEDLTRLH